MALVLDQKLRRSFSIKKSNPLMLRDYLRDDLSSCSSNGFKSFPRRECCATVRLLLEIELKAKGSNSNSTRRLPPRSTSKAASTTISALQRASEAVVNAVKRLQFSSIKSQSLSAQPQRSAKKGLLSRSFSRKLLKRSFWRKADHKGEQVIKQWKSFREFLEEKDPPSDEDAKQYLPTPTVTPVSKCVSTSSSSKSTSNSWSESEFTVASTGTSESSSENDSVDTKKEVKLHDDDKSVTVSDGVGVSVGKDSITTAEENTKDWPNEEEKEQFSPVSVLDCPFEDETEINSPLQRSIARIEGTKRKLMRNIRRFETLAHLEPVDLRKRIASSELDPDSYYKNKAGEVEEPETERRAEELLKLVKSTTTSNSVTLLCKAENLLSDFFKDEIDENHGNGNSKSGCKGLEKDLLKVAQDYVNGENQELVLGWEVEKGRKAYISEMEKNGRWRNYKDEKQEVALDLEIELFTSLVNELAFDLF